jgi:ubiquinone/menaquinone biosynthesis C-methylase UbiE
MLLGTPGNRNFRRPRAEVLALLDLEDSERVFDIGSGDGRITAEIAASILWGSVAGVDSSHNMIAFASSRFGTTLRPNVRFEVADGDSLPFGEEFDLVVSFNAPHCCPRRTGPLRRAGKLFGLKTGLELLHRQNAQCRC